MEAGTAASHSTGSKTIADLMACAAEQFADRVAVRHKVDGDWRDVTFAEVGDVVREIGVEEQLQAPLRAGVQRPRRAGPEQAVVDEHEVGALFARAREQIRVGADARDDCLDVVPTGYL